MTTDAELYSLAERLYPLPRTVMGDAVQRTFWHLIDFIGAFSMAMTDVPVGTRVFDWKVLPEWKNRRHYHPTLNELPAYDGPLTYGECIVRGSEPKEVLLSTYTCHGPMANDNVSGMVVTAALAKWLASEPRRYSYRVLFAPETIGALCWLWTETEKLGWHVGEALFRLRERIIAGYTINCCGDERAWSFIPSRKGNTLADRAARHVLPYVAGRNVDFAPFGGPNVRYLDDLRIYDFSQRGSDERQFCAPGVDLPVASVMRSKHGTFPEYHTKADDLSVITPKGLGDSFRCYQRIIETIESNRTYHVTTIGEPMLSKYGFHTEPNGPEERDRIARDLCAYSDGETDLLAIAELTNRPIWDIAPVATQLLDAGVLR